MVFSSFIGLMTNENYSHYLNFRNTNKYRVTVGKIDQIKHIALEETIEYKINDYIQNEKYQEYDKYYLVDIGLNSLEYTFSDYEELTQEGENKDFILVISQHTLANKAINIMYNNAKNEWDGYSLEFSFDDIFVLKHQSSTNGVMK